MELTPVGRPSISTETVRKTTLDYYGIDGTLKPLPAEWDQNFQLDSADGDSFVIKIANRARSIEELDFENEAMKLLAGSWVSGKCRCKPSRQSTTGSNRHTAMERDLRWDLRKAEWISPYISRIPDVRRRGIVERLLLQRRRRPG